VEDVQVIFEGTAINISTQGQRHLGAALGSREYLEQYVGSKVEDWVSQVVKLAEFAMSQPQACYAAFTSGLRHQWTHLSSQNTRRYRRLARTFRTRHCRCLNTVNNGPSLHNAEREGPLGAASSTGRAWNYKSKPGYRSTVALKRQ